MTPLARHLAALIGAQGPITVARYMAEALGNPHHGYYMTRDPLGRAGDFITAPEISQIFGEIVGLWFASLWQRMGTPDPVIVVELGPGRGTLMADALRAAAVMPGFTQAIELHLVETSPVLREHQRQQLDATWHERFLDVPEGPTLVVANELFDALPIHQLVRGNGGWCERLVGLNDDGDGFAPVVANTPSPLAALVPESLSAAPAGSLCEVCPAGLALAGDIGHRLTAFGGAGLIIDYGHAVSAIGDTLQAVRDHRRHHVFTDPGEADLTAHVDFAQLARAAGETGTVVHGPIDQGTFLAHMGINERARRLLAGADVPQAEAITSGVARLTAADQMGRLFKAMAFTAPSLTTIEGFPER